MAPLPFPTEAIIESEARERGRAVYRGFLHVDRLCRDFGLSRPLDVLLRSVCLHELGFDADALSDLDIAAQVGGAELGVQRAVIERHPDREARHAAALAILDHPRATQTDWSDALRYLLKEAPLALHVVRTRVGVSGRVAWTDHSIPRLLARTGSAACPLEVTIERSDATDPVAATFSFDSPDYEIVVIEARVADIVRTVVSRPLVGAPAGSPPKIAGLLTVVIPIYGGFAATRACLEALASQTCRAELDVVVIDDASPDLGLATHVETVCDRQGWRYLRQSVNAGFAATVNRGLALARGADVLILNADAILPSGALDRLLDAAAQPQVGTVVPFSNDGGFTSFPRMRIKNRVPTTAAAQDLDGAALRSNAGRIVDLPSGTAFCMLVTRACLEKVGHLDLGYGRGYFEDVDFCLRAARHGFRNVAATDVFVAHVGSQSFGADKRALAAVNAERIRERFPDYEIAWASFVDADPLAAARAAIERFVPPNEPVRLVVGRRARLSALLDLVATEAKTPSSMRVLELGWSRSSDVTIKAADGETPQTLAFAPRQQAALIDYLNRLDVVGIDIAEPDAVPAPLRDALLATGAPLTVWATDLATVAFLTGERAAWLAGLTIVPMDTMVKAALRGGAPSPRRQTGHLMREGRRLGGAPSDGAVAAVLGVLMPTATVTALSVLSILAMRWARGRSGPIIVFGDGLGESLTPAAEPMHFTGPMTPSDYPAAVRHHRISHLLLPYRDRFFRHLEDLLAKDARPAASPS